MTCYFCNLNKDINIENKKQYNFDISKNYLIKGDNLDVLYAMQDTYKNKIKLIYIDPPYNTKTKRNYKDNFTHQEYLDFMYPRLEIARDLLRDDGVIFVQIDDNEQAYLKVLMDEIFSRHNFVNNISLRSSTPSGIKTAHKNKTIIKQKEYILVYANKSLNLKLKPQYKKRTEWDTHYNSFLNDKKEIERLVDVLQKHKIHIKSLKDIDIDNKEFKKFYTKYKDNIFRLSSTKNIEFKNLSKKRKNEILTDSNSNRLYYNGNEICFLNKQYKKIIENKNNTPYKLNDLGMLLCDFWDDIDFNNTQNEVKDIKFTSAKKPLKLLYRIIDMTTNEGDIVLDFFAGSGTTAHACMQMNRRWIAVEQMDYIENITKERLKKVINGEQGGISKDVSWQGGGEFIYFDFNLL